MMQSYHILKDQSHQIHSEQKFKDDTILPRSQVSKSLDPFLTKVQVWYNPTTFSSTEVTRSILSKISRMIQSYHVLEYRSHWIHSKKIFKDDTILPRYRVWKSPDPFWTKFQGWYNPTTFLSTELIGSILNKSSRMIQSNHILEDQSHWICSEPNFRNDTC